MSTDKLEQEKERNRLKRMIREGKLPRCVFAKDPNDKNMKRMERKPGKRGRMKLTWRTVDTVSMIMGEKK